MINNIQFIIYCVLILSTFSCKNKDKIILETAIDHFEHNNINLAEHSFKKLIINKNNMYYQNAQDYLSQINKIESNISDTILYDDAEKLEDIFVPLEKDNTNDMEIYTLFNNSREYINNLYANNKYELALQECNNLIWVFEILNKNNEEKYELEMSQIYQDMAVIYAKKNNLPEAKAMIKKAMELNPTKQNQKILELLS